MRFLVFRVVLLVDHGPVLDGLCVVRVLERAHRLLVVDVGRGEAGDHHGARVAAQRVLKGREKESELFFRLDEWPLIKEGNGTYAPLLNRVTNFL